MGLKKCELNTFAAVLAGGSGSRMGNLEKPKQFLMLGTKPVLVHTVEKLCMTGLFDVVLVLCPQAWMQQTKDTLLRFCPNCIGNVLVVAGGETRNDTVMNAVSFIDANYNIDDDTILVTHDAVRPFVTHRIVCDNIDAARKQGACDTVIPATDTIVESVDAQMISAIPNRNNFYQGQTPQSFNLQKLKVLLDSLTEEEKVTLTDVCKVFVLRGEKVALVMGDALNMKITFPQDMRLAAALVGEQRA